MHIRRNSILAAILFLSVSPTVLSQRPDPKIEKLAEELLQTDSPEKRGELLAGQKELVTPNLGKELVKQGNLLLLAGRYATALDVYTFAEGVATRINDKDGQASSTLNIGTVHYFQGDYEVALKHYLKARNLFVAVGNQVEAARALSGAALIYKEQGKDAEALLAYEQTLKEYESLDDTEEMSKTLSSMGSIYFARGQHTAASKAFVRSAELNDASENLIQLAGEFYRQRDYQQASDFYLKALQRFEAAHNPAGTIASLGGAANSFYFLGNYDDALKYYQLNLKFQREFNDESGVVTSLQGIGNVYTARGDLGSALASYRLSLRLAEQSQIKVSIAATLGGIGLVRAMQGNNAEARNYYGKSLQEFEETGDKVGMARMQALLGNVSFSQGSFKEAIESYRKGLSIRQEIGDRSAEADLLIGIGTVSLAEKNFEESLGNYQKALSIFESTGNKSGIAIALTKIADANFSQGDYAGVLNVSDRAAALAKETESWDTLWYARLMWGKAQVALGMPTEASKAFDEAITIVESLRSVSKTDAAARGRNNLLPYFAQIDLTIDENKPGEAFELTERARVQTLVELVKRSPARVTRGMTHADRAAENRLSVEVVSLTHQLDRETQSRTNDAARLMNLLTQLRQKLQALVALRKQIYLKNPKLKTHRGELLPLKLRETAALVADTQTALLEYVSTEDQVLLFVVTAQPGREATGRVKRNTREPAVMLKAYPLDINPGELVRRVIDFCDVLASPTGEFLQPSRELYDLLVKPAEEQLATRSQLVIAPDGILWRLPFEALQSADGRYLIERASTSYTPSLTALRELKRARPAKPSTRAKTLGLTAFGSPQLPDQFWERVEAGDKDKRIGGAEAQERELQSLRNVYGDTQSRVYQGANATEERAKGELERARTLHLAANGLLDDTSPMYSFIALAPGVSDRADDGLLQTWEILKLNSRARLVVLSGTSMNRSPLGAGSATVGTLWAWFVAGTPSVAVSRWNVNSPSVALLMGDFHSSLKSKPSVSMADAMRQSALKLRRSDQYAHPYFWSGFAILGDAR